MTIYTLDVLLSLFGTSLLFHVQFSLLLSDLRTEICIHISQEAGWVVWYSHLFKNFPVCCDPHSQRLWHGHKAEVDVFLELLCFFNDPMDVGSLISVFS